MDSEQKTKHKISSQFSMILGGARRVRAIIQRGGIKCAKLFITWFRIPFLNHELRQFLRASIDRDSTYHFYRSVICQFELLVRHSFVQFCPFL